MWLRVCPPMLVKLPPTKILPSACTTIAGTIPLPFAFGLNESARPVVGSSRAMRLRSLSADAVKSAAHQNLAVRLHRDCIDKTFGPFAFGSKAVSSVPSVFNRAMLLRGTPKTLVKCRR